MPSVTIFDPTATDNLSRVRGVGRYVQTLRETFGNEWKFTSDLSSADPDGTLVNPFINLLAKPTLYRRIAKKQIGVIHDVIPLKYPQNFPIGIKGKLYLAANKIALRYYDHIITDSEASKRDIVSHLHIPENKISIAYATTLKKYFEEYSLPESLPYNLTPNSYFLYVGDATWNKNLVNIAKAVQAAKVKLVCVGSVFTKRIDNNSNPWLSELVEFQHITKDDPHFLFPGFVSDEDLMALYAGTTANVLVSRDEGFGLSYLEAAALSTPTIAAETPIQKEIAGDAAYFVQPEDPVSIQNALTQLNTDKTQRNRLGEAAHKQSGMYSPLRFRSLLSEAART